MEPSIDLPNVFADDVIRVDDEPHEYEVYSDDTTKDEYTLDKAGDDAIEMIREVRGEVNGRDHVFIRSVDYELSSDNERVVWLSGERPDDNTTFYVTYRTEPIIKRYVGAGEEELSKAQDALIRSITSKFIDKAADEDLDKIGKLFGDLGKRRNRPEGEYRIYLKSIVQSSISRGTVNGIKSAVAAAVDLNPDQVEIIEDFENSSYVVRLPPVSAHAASTVEDVAEIADPSGVKQKLTRYELPPEDMVVNDFVNYTTGDATTTDTLYLDDTVEREVETATSDTFYSDDAATVEENPATWGTDWNVMYWT